MAKFIAHRFSADQKIDSSLLGKIADAKGLMFIDAGGNPEIGKYYYHINYHPADLGTEILETLKAISLDYEGRREYDLAK